MFSFFSDLAHGVKAAARGECPFKHARPEALSHPGLITLGQWLTDLSPRSNSVDYMISGEREKEFAVVFGDRRFHPSFHIASGYLGAKDNYPEKADRDSVKGVELLKGQIHGIVRSTIARVSERLDETR